MSDKNYEKLIAEISEKIAALAVSMRGTTGDERKRIQDEITRLSEEIRQCAQSSALRYTSNVQKNTADSTVDFWDLGTPKPRIYKKPEFEGRTLGTTEIDNEYESSPAKSEKIPPRDSLKIDSTSRMTTGSYRRNSYSGRGFSGSFGSKAGTSPANPIKKESKLLREYTPGGILIHKVSVKTWETGNEFYGRFTADATLSHRATSKFEPDAQIRPVPYLSYVPQYAHMNSAQIDYYRWLRENIRRGRYPDCDLGYIQLYIFEIFNLPREIPPEEGVKLITGIWLNYRDRHPRLDGYLCEWFADYCLANGCSLPSELETILHIIAPKAQFKEFYLDSLVTKAVNSTDSSATADLGRTVIEVSSDYDYRSARYYADNREAFDKHIPAAVGKAIKALVETKTEPFSLDREYKMTRDSFSGAIVSSEIKRRVDIEFSSFTRRADVRDAVTALVKYSENKVRVMLGIKSKLRTEDLPSVSEAAINEYFAPLLPVLKAVRKEDEFMPRDYLKLYESEDSGFDFGKAAEIERQSWVNTERLTGEEYVDKAEEYLPDEEIFLEGEVSFEYTTEIEITPEEPANIEVKADIKDALNAALCGNFREYCRASSLYDGEVADRINTLFLDIIGDVVLYDCGNGYEIIEDYREDAENWLQTQ